MGLFSCKVCEQKDLRIEDLKAQIKFLQSMLAPNGGNAVNMEANKILDGASLPVLDIEMEPNNEVKAQMMSAEQEATRILTGGYYEAE